MGRLTIRIDGEAYIEKVANKYCEDVCSSRNRCNDCPIRDAFNKLAHYEDLEEQGRLIELPCALGTKVFHVYADDCGNIPCLYGDCETCKSAYWKIIETTFKTMNIEDFGKTVFLTKEEALAKLEELKGGGSNE